MNHKKAIAYIRVSTTHQDVERQRIKFKEYCKNNNLQANEEIIDFGIFYQLFITFLGRQVENIKSIDPLLYS